MPSKLQQYCIQLYEALDEVTEGNTWEGRITRFYADTGLPEGYRSRVLKRLEVIGSLRRDQRGVADHTPTRIILIAHPNDCDWKSKDLTGGDPAGSLRSELEGIKRQLGGLDIRRALVELQQQIDSLRTEIESLTAR